MKLRLGLTTAVVAVAGLAVPGIVTAPGAHGEKAPTTSPVSLAGPARVAVSSYDDTVYDIGLTLTAGEDPFELRSRRASWTSPIRTVWQSPTGPVALPEGMQTSWNALPGFVNIAISRASDGKLVKAKRLDVCLNSWNTQRTTPDAPLRSPYPQGCPENPFTLGTVQGIQREWVAAIDTGEDGLRLSPGTYTVLARIPSAWAKPLDIKPADSVRTYRLVVTREVEEDEGRGHRDSSLRARPARTEPRTARAGAPGDAVPDLKALPAFGMMLSPSTKYLQFSATVWNAGTGPLVVDGFRRGSSDVMDAYQYFIDSEGNQTGYQKVGTMIWHQAPSHNHWHFKDFAKYSLLNADLSEVVISRKESFCLANTDAVDHTIRGADWQPENTDLHTACGDRSSISLREVLASGSGDTYAQFRAGQSFRIDNLPNGIYYIAVEGNPNRNLVELRTTNNRSLRKIKLSGTPTHRKLTVGRVGVIDDRGYGLDEGY